MSAISGILFGYDLGGSGGTFVMDSFRQWADWGPVPVKGTAESTTVADQQGIYLIHTNKNNIFIVLFCFVFILFYYLLFICSFFLVVADQQGTYLYIQIIIFIFLLFICSVFISRGRLTR